MAGYKETPRQKMIAMMYLVLTALLALNVSKDILEAFLVVNESIETTNTNFSSKNQATLSKFKQQYEMNQAKVGPFWTKAQEAANLSHDIIEYIDWVKFALVAESEGSDDSLTTLEEYYVTTYVPDPANPRDSIPQTKLSLKDVPTKDKYDQATNFFIGDSQDGSAGESKRLRDKIDEYRTKMLELINQPTESRRLGLITDDNYFNADGQKVKNWEMYNFYHTILAADITILNKIIAEVHNAEFDVISILFSNISAKDFKFDQIAAKVIPKSRYVLLGEDYNAEVLVAAYDSKTTPKVLILEGADTLTRANIANAKEVDGLDGLVNLVLPATSEGTKKYAGLIEIQTPTGETNTYHFKDEYIVAKPALTVAATKMNVFYIGVDNPVSISVPGMADELLNANISAGTLSRDPKGGWNVRVPTGVKKATINVSAGSGSGSKPMGGAEFRVKRVPDPTAKIANTAGGNISKGAMLAAGAIIPQMPEDFEFELFFEITSFTFVSVRSGDVFEELAKGNRLNEKMKTFLQSAKRGTKVWLEDIYAKGPDGNRKLATISLTIQ